MNKYWLYGLALSLQVNIAFAEASESCQKAMKGSHDSVFVSLGPKYAAAVSNLVELRRTTDQNQVKGPGLGISAMMEHNFNKKIEELASETGRSPDEIREIIKQINSSKKTPDLKPQGDESAGAKEWKAKIKHENTVPRYQFRSTRPIDLIDSKRRIETRGLMSEQGLANGEVLISTRIENFHSPGSQPRRYMLLDPQAGKIRELPVAGIPKVLEGAREMAFLQHPKDNDQKMYKIIRYDIMTQKMISEIEVKVEPSHLLDWEHQGNFLVFDINSSKTQAALGGLGGHIVLVDLKTGEIIRTEGNAEKGGALSTVYSLHFLSDGEVVYNGLRKIYRLKLSEEQPVETPELTSKNMSAPFARSADGQFAFWWDYQVVKSVDLNTMQVFAERSVIESRGGPRDSDYKFKTNKDFKWVLAFPKPPKSRSQKAR